MRPVVRLVVPLLVTLASATAAQDARLERLAPETRAPVVGLIDSARSAGLPAEPLVQRALEGATKHAGGDLIMTALRRLAGDLGGAREALGGAASPAELSAGAAALRAGAPPSVLAELRRTRRQSLTVPLAVLTDLVASGVPADSAAAAVLALAARVRDPELVEFRHAVERDIALGASPGAAAWAGALAASSSLAPGAHGGQQLPPRKP
ncbi:MAG TPA: hypothetical protein VM736_12530 [Gemmatimonadales bacterium]|nr:hypothetical protein [Gemmatimonadales bacterium]